MVVFLVNLEVLGEVGNPLTQESDLDFGRTGVAFMQPMLLDDCLLLFCEQCQLFISS